MYLCVSIGFLFFVYSFNSICGNALFSFFLGLSKLLFTINPRIPETIFIIKNKIKFLEKIKRYTDTIFNINAFELAKNIEYYNKYIYHYRKNKYSITHNYYAEMKNDVKTYLKETKKYIKIYNKDSDFKQTYYISVITKITSYLEMSYKKINIKQELKQLKQEYKYELQNINKNKINIYQKLMLKNIEKEKIAGIKILITLHKIYLKI